MIHFGEERSYRTKKEDRVRPAVAFSCCLPPLYLSLFRFTLCLCDVAPPQAHVSFKTRSLRHHDDHESDVRAGGA